MPVDPVPTDDVSLLIPDLTDVPESDDAEPLDARVDGVAPLAEGVSE